MKLTAIFIFLVICCNGFSQKPANGIFTYKVAFAEWSGKSMGATCSVKIKGDSVWIIHNGKGNLSGDAGEIIDSGVMMKHKSGKWIIGRSAQDKNAKEIGGCSDGPRVIDFKKKIVWFC
jgi:hypothetical protein